MEDQPLTLEQIQKEIDECKKKLAFLEDLKKQLQEKSKESSELLSSIGFQGWGC